MRAHVLIEGLRPVANLLSKQYAPLRDEFVVFLVNDEGTTFALTIGDIRRAEQLVKKYDDAQAKPQAPQAR